ncbi:MAG: 4Fe-4S binding protein [Deltaproteobacteria bacterium]|nr:4Fe-4S binding protein [Deltaproteobacteria bacterium]
MNISSVKLAYFSPTKTTQKILEAIAQGVEYNDVGHIDLTPPDSRTRTFEDFNQDLVIIGAPVYGGRLAGEAVKRISMLKGHYTPAVVVVLYGNREYEDALLELKDLAIKLGFVPVAGGAFIGEHSYTKPEFPLSAGRPHSQDLEKAMGFGKAIRRKMDAIKDIKSQDPIDVPGHFPYKDHKPSSNESASTLEDICIACGTCAAICPTAAIMINERVETDSTLCIRCCACVKSCPTQARVMESSRIDKIVKWLSENYSVPKQPETFI